MDYSIIINFVLLIQIPGIIPLAVSDVFDKLTVLRDQLGDQFKSNSVTISYIEIYNEKVYDLLSTTEDVKNLRFLFHFIFTVILITTLIVRFTGFWRTRMAYSLFKE